MPDLSTIFDIVEKSVLGASVLAGAIALVYKPAGKLAGVLKVAHDLLSKVGLNSKPLPPPDRPGVRVKLDKPDA